MAGLVPAIRVFIFPKATKTWMPGTRPGMTTLWLRYPTNPCIGFTVALSGNTLSASTFSASPN